MADNTTISIGWKIEDAGNGMKKITMSAEELQKLLKSAVVESEKLKTHLVNFAAVATGIDSISSSLESLKSVVDEYAAAYDTQMEVETQLEHVMRTTMDARDEDIQSIKDFCSAQQEIGIIGDEVQLAGAQELATYLTLKSSLKSVIPVMNDMLAQQFGLAATGENAAQIASMLGKVLNGQAEALSRYGYKFDEAQKKILQYGTEAEKVAVLCEVVSESVGGMNARMAQTDIGRMKQLDNTLGDVKEQLGAVAKRVQPVLTVGANATIALAGVVKLTQGLRALIVTLNLTKAAAGWIGLALTALAAVATWLISRNNEAADSFDRLTDATQRANRAEEMATDLAESEEDARKAATSALELNISKLKNFNGTKEEEKKLVKEMNDTYGTTMGYFKKVSEWYNTLIKNSKAYTQQMVNEAKARTLANQIAELEGKRDAVAYNEDGSKKMYSTYREEKWVPTGQKRYDNAGNVAGWQYKKIYLPSDKDKAQESFEDYDRQAKAKRKQLDAINAEKPEMPVMGDTKVPELSATETTRLQEINKLLTQYQEQYVNADEKTRTVIRAKVAELTREKEAIEMAKAELERPLKLETIDDYQKEITYLEKRRKTVSAEEIAAIDETITRLRQEMAVVELSGRTELKCAEDYEKEISRLNDLKRTATVEETMQIQQVIDKTTEEYEAFQRSSHERVSAEKITSYKELEEEISFCNELLRTGTEEERRWATENLPALMQKERAMSAAMSAVGVAATPDEANSIEEMDAAISLVQDRIRRASAEEIEELERTRLSFERKKKAYELGIRIPEMQKEVSDLQKLPDRELRIKVKGMGFESLTEKIREIDKELNNLDHPPTEGQRKALTELRKVYAGWRREAVMSFDTLQNGWSGVKEIGSGVESLTNALQGNANAWQTLTGIVDGFIQIYEGIAAVVSILETIKTISEATTTAKTAEATATVEATTATAVEAGTAETAALAQAPVIAANKAATASYVELAASQYMAAHASIPFAGFGLGAGFAEAAAATVKSIGAIPFADGGVVYGPTLGLVGEYAGASSNPEVIAPLDKLKEIIGDTGSGSPVIIGGRLEVSGRSLAVVLENQTRITGMSGKRNRI